MKSIKLNLLYLAISCVFICCSKSGGEDEGEDCQDANTTKITYKNDGSTPLKVVVARSLTSSFEPIDPAITLDLAPGASVVKEIDAGQYFTLWYRDCPSACSRITYYNKTFAQCGEYEEKQGI